MGMGGNRDSETLIVTMKKDALLTILKSNREKHVADYAKARLGYQKLALAKLEALTTAFQNHNFSSDARMPQLDVTEVTRPVSYEDSYTRAINMLGHHTGDEFKLDQSAYARYVEDNWEWSHVHRTSNSRYLN